MAEEPILAKPQSVEPSNYDLNPFPSDWSNNRLEGSGRGVGICLH